MCVYRLPPTHYSGSPLTAKALRRSAFHRPRASCLLSGELPARFAPPPEQGLPPNGRSQWRWVPRRSGMWGHRDPRAWLWEFGETLQRFSRDCVVRRTRHSNIRRSTCCGGKWQPKQPKIGAIVICSRSRQKHGAARIESMHSFLCFFVRLFVSSLPTPFVIRWVRLGAGPQDTDTQGSPCPQGAGPWPAAQEVGPAEGVSAVPPAPLLLQNGPVGVGGPRHCYRNEPLPRGLSLWSLCPPPGVRNYGFQCRSLVKRNCVFKRYPGPE